MGKIELDHTGSGSGITLSSDGTDLLLDGTAIGGGGGDPDLYRDNASSAITPTASGTNAVAVGHAAVASANRAMAFGASTDATAGWSCALGNGAQAGGENSVAIGASRATSSGAVAIGIGGNSTNGATGSSSIAIGNSARADGTRSVAFTKSHASGEDSFAAAVMTSSTSYGATGTNAVAIGQNARATGNGAFAFGFNTLASNSRAHAFGPYAQATNSYCLAIGNTAYATGYGAIAIGWATADGYKSIAIGERSQTNGIAGAIVFSNGSNQSGNVGDAQTGLYILKGMTTDATPLVLTTNGTTAGSDDQLILVNNSAYSFHGTIVGREKAGDGTDCAAWKVEGLIRREGSAGTTTLVASTVTAISNTPSWGLALSADTTNGCLKVQVTGAASTNIKWTGTVHTSEAYYN